MQISNGCPDCQATNITFQKQIMIRRNTRTYHSAGWEGSQEQATGRHISSRVSIIYFCNVLSFTKKTFLENVLLVLYCQILKSVLFSLLCVFNRVWTEFVNVTRYSFT